MSEDLAARLMRHLACTDVYGHEDEIREWFAEFGRALDEAEADYAEEAARLPTPIDRAAFRNGARWAIERWRRAVES